jgi:hypothetical protein
MSGTPAPPATPARRFTRFRPGAESAGPGYSVVPGNGFCISTFLILHPPGDRRKVLLGRPDVNAPWLELGGLDPKRLGDNAEKWLLPACQWLVFEEPRASAERIARDMLDAALPAVSGPTVFADTTERATPDSRDPHWDLHFLYEGDWPTATPPKARLWRELAFHDVGALPRATIGRSQADILAFAGLAPPE